MKKMMFVIVSSVLASVSIVAQQRSVEKELAYLPARKFMQNDKVKIKKEELPEGVKNTLEGSAYKGWAIENAYKLTNGDFEVELKKGDTAQTLKFDKDGKVR